MLKYVHYQHYNASTNNILCYIWHIVSFILYCIVIKGGFRGGGQGGHAPKMPSHRLAKQLNNVKNIIKHT